MDKITCITVWLPIFMAPPSKDKGHVVLPLFICLHRLNVKTERFPLTSELQSTLIIKMSDFANFRISRSETLVPKLSSSYFQIETNFYVKVSNPSTMLISNFLCTNSVFELSQSTNQITK